MKEKEFFTYYDRLLVWCIIYISLVHERSEDKKESYAGFLKVAVPNDPVLPKESRIAVRPR